ncbi:uncharacterized protein LOC121368380 [Gigantopelta aegis]|uniref:uncharacterized protein LOC121368380 n=1 Tax=Gigantopelta aegis TaxID=1735272 RepID=UPI001B88D983|nr:uncharacterized protein LOC121368380 [Gigantopelta aegis]XP_041349009.1 uncharacterized protein LOC121368380 [Gigantopelta aegis]
MAHRYKEDCEPLLSTPSTLCSSYESPTPGTPPQFVRNLTKALPEGKTHHLFFSHSSDDQQWVLEWVELLEQDYGIKCLWPPRDFTPGRPILSLIEDGMSRAMKIVLVLSPEYIDSGWCIYERRLAFDMSVQERRDCIIPVILKPCPVPDMLRTVNYIDVTKGENAVCKIKDALYKKCELKDNLPNAGLQYHQQDKKGMKISVSAEKENSSSVRGTAWYFKSLSTYQDQLLRKMGSKISREGHDLTVTELNSLFYMRIFGLVKRTATLYWFSLFFFLGICSFSLLAGCLMSMFHVYVTHWLALILVPLLVIIPICTVMYIPLNMLIRRKIKQLGIRRARQIVKATSLEWFQQAKLLLYFNEESVPTLLFMYYDTDACQLYLRDCFLRLYSANAENSEKEALARRVADHHIRLFLSNQYDRILQWNDLDESIHERHATVMRKKCLCEMIEEDLWPK